LRPASYSVPDDIRATLVRLLAYMGGLAVLAVAAASFFQAPSGVAALGRAPAARPVWRTVERPYPAFELLMPELAGSDYNYAIQRRAADGARKDMLTWGDATAAGPFVMVEIYRTGSAGDRFIDASSEIGARIIDYTVTDDVKPIGRIDSKFGPVQIVDFAIAPHGQERGQERNHERRCLGFARPFIQPAMQLAGWYCSAGREVVDRATLACLLDRLTLVNGEQKFAELFAHAEVKRTFCGQRSPILAATPEREGQIAPGRSTKLRSALRGHMPTH
jgi:hypothetical protein